MSYALPLTIVVVALISVMLAPKSESSERLFCWRIAKRRSTKFVHIDSKPSDHLDFCALAAERRNSGVLLRHVGHLGLCGLLSFVPNGWGDY